MSWLLKQVNGVSRILHLSFLNQAEQSYHPIEEPAWQVVARSWTIYSNVSVTGETETERTGRIAAANLMEQLVFVHISPFP